MKPFPKNIALALIFLSGSLAHACPDMTGTYKIETLEKNCTPINSEPFYELEDWPIAKQLDSSVQGVTGIESKSVLKVTQYDCDRLEIQYMGYEAGKGDGSVLPVSLLFNALSAEAHSLEGSQKTTDKISKVFRGKKLKHISLSKNEDGSLTINADLKLWSTFLGLRITNKFKAGSKCTFPKTP